MDQDVVQTCRMRTSYIFQPVEDSSQLDRCKLAQI